MEIRSDYSSNKITTSDSSIEYPSEKEERLNKVFLRNRDLVRAHGEYEEKIQKKIGIDGICISASLSNCIAVSTLTIISSICLLAIPFLCTGGVVLFAEIFTRYSYLFLFLVGFCAMPFFTLALICCIGCVANACTMRWYEEIRNKFAHLYMALTTQKISNTVFQSCNGGNRVPATEIPKAIQFLDDTCLSLLDFDQVRSIYHKKEKTFLDHYNEEKFNHSVSYLWDCLFSIDEKKDESLASFLKDKNIQRNLNNIQGFFEEAVSKIDACYLTDRKIQKIFHKVMKKKSEKVSSWSSDKVGVFLSDIKEGLSFEKALEKHLERDFHLLFKDGEMDISSINLREMSPYFERLLSIDMREARESQIEFSDINLDDFRLLLEFHNGAVTLDKKNIALLFNLSERFLFEEERNICKTYILNNFRSFDDLVDLKKRVSGSFPFIEKMMEEELEKERANILKQCTHLDRTLKIYSDFARSEEEILKEEILSKVQSQFINWKNSVINEPIKSIELLDEMNTYGEKLKELHLFDRFSKFLREVLKNKVVANKRILRIGWQYASEHEIEWLQREILKICRKKKYQPIVEKVFVTLPEDLKTLIKLDQV